jgi:hypothetical protein
LSVTLAGLQAERKQRPIVVALHHSPFFDSELGKLVDSEEFLQIVTGKIDCLLFGHTGDAQATHTSEANKYGISLINSENLEKMNTSYPVSLIRLDSLASHEPEVYATNPPPVVPIHHPVRPPIDHGDPPLPPGWAPR